MDFAPGLIKVTLRPRSGCVPKVLSTLFHSQGVTLHSFHPPPLLQARMKASHALYCPNFEDLCGPLQPLETIPQLLVCFGAGRRGLATLKHHKLSLGEGWYFASL